MGSLFGGIIGIFALGAVFALILRIIIRRHCTCSSDQENLARPTTLDISTGGQQAYTPSTSMGQGPCMTDELTINVVESPSPDKSLYAEPFTIPETEDRNISSNGVKSVKFKKHWRHEPLGFRDSDTSSVCSEAYGADISTPSSFVSVPELSRQFSVRRKIANSLKFRSSSGAYGGLKSSDYSHSDIPENAIVDNEYVVIENVRSETKDADGKIQCLPDCLPDWKAIRGRLHEMRSYQTESSTSSSRCSSVQNSFRGHRKYSKIEADFEPKADLGLGNDNPVFRALETESEVDEGHRYPTLRGQYLKKDRNLLEKVFLRSLSTASSNATASGPEIVYL